MSEITPEIIGLQKLVRQTEFLDFLWTVIQMSGILTPATNGSDGRNLAFAEGRRNLGFEVLAHVEQAWPVQHPDSLMTILQVVREAAQKPTETQNGKRTRYDRTRDFDGPGGGSARDDDPDAD